MQLFFNNAYNEFFATVSQGINESHFLCLSIAEQFFLGNSGREVQQPPWLFGPHLSRARSHTIDSSSRGEPN
jgi:hypothetical protein